MIGLILQEGGIGCVIEDKTKTGMVAGEVIFYGQITAGYGDKAVGLALQVVIDELAVPNTAKKNSAGEILGGMPGGIRFGFPKTGTTITKAAVLDREFLTVNGLDALCISVDLQVLESDILEAVETNPDTGAAVPDKARTAAFNRKAAFCDYDPIGQEVGARIQTSVLGENHLIDGLDGVHIPCLSVYDCGESSASKIGNAARIVAMLMVGMGLSKCAACSGEAGRWMNPAGMTSPWVLRWCIRV